MKLLNVFIVIIISIISCLLTPSSVYAVKDESLTSHLRSSLAVKEMKSIKNKIINNSNNISKDDYEAFETCVIDYLNTNTYSDHCGYVQVWVDGIDKCLSVSGEYRESIVAEYCYNYFPYMIGECKTSTPFCN